MQHLNSKCRERDVENETKTEDLLLRCTEGTDVGSVAERRFYALAIAGDPPRNRNTSAFSYRGDIPLVADSVTVSLSTVGQCR